MPKPTGHRRRNRDRKDQVRAVLLETPFISSVDLARKLGIHQRHANELQRIIRAEIQPPPEFRELMLARLREIALGWLGVVEALSAMLKDREWLSEDSQRAWTTAQATRVILDCLARTLPVVTQTPPPPVLPPQSSEKPSMPSDVNGEPEHERIVDVTPERQHASE